METIDFANQKFCHYLYAVVDSCATITPELNKADVSLVPYRDIACVTTIVSTSEYCKDVPSSSPEQLDWVAPRVMKHHQVLMEMMAHTTIVPFSFGALCASINDVEAILATRYKQFRDLLEQLQGKEEWVVSVFIDPSNLVQHLEQSEQQIQELDSFIANKTGGEAYLLRKKKERITAALQTSALEQIHDECHQRLSKISDSVFATQCGNSPECRTQVLSATVLSARTNFELLERTAWEIENLYARYSASVCLSGPWPAYSSAKGHTVSE